MRNVYVTGASMTRFARHDGATLRSLSREAVSEALLDGGLSANQVEAVYFGNSGAGVIDGQHMIRGQAALRDSGLLGTRIVNVENACASGATAFQQAWLDVASGHSDVAVAVGADKLTDEDRELMLSVFDYGIDLSSPPLESASGDHSIFMDIYADMSRQYMERTGATAEDFALVAEKNHRHAVHNPKAQFRQEFPAARILASRMIAEPLTLLMCSPVSDGAAALVLCSEAVHRKAGVPAAKVRATALVSGRDRVNDDEPGTTRAARRAYEIAGISPGDIDVVELHDAAAPAELFLYEELGLCAEGDGPSLLRSGATAIGGRMPVNPSGGLLSKGHPIGATGCGQLVELVDQLRDRCGERQVEGARIALAENGGGHLSNDLAAASAIILERA